MADKEENVRTTLMYFVISVESTHCNKDVWKLQNLSRSLLRLLWRKASRPR